MSNASLLKSRTGWSPVLPNALRNWRLSISSCTCIIRADSGAVTEETQFGIRQTRMLRDSILYPQRTVAARWLGRTDMVTGAWIVATIDR